MLASPLSKLSRVAAIFLLILVALMLTPRTSLAQTIVRGDQLNSGEVIDNDVIMFGDEVHLAGTVKGNAFITGRDITIDGHVEGSLFTIGQRVTINGTVDGSAYVIALSLRLSATGFVGQNLYFVGVSMTTERGSQIGRDLNGLCLGAILQGSVGRNTQLIAGLVQFFDLFFDIALGPTPNGLQIAGLTGRAPGLGQFILPGDIVIDVFGHTVNSTQTTPQAVTQSELVAEWFMARLREFLPLLIVGLIGYWFLRKPLEAASTVIKQQPLPALGLGLVGLILSCAVVGAFILVFILILMVGIWIGRTTFWNISWLLWSVAFPLVGLVLSLFLVFLNLGTKVITTYAWTTFAADRFAPRAGSYRPLLLILGLAVYVMLRAIPLLGWVIGVLVTAWGIGGAWLAWRERRAISTPVALLDVPAPSDATPDDVFQEGQVDEEL